MLKLQTSFHFIKNLIQKTQRCGGEGTYVFVLKWQTPCVVSPLCPNTRSHGGPPEGL